MRRLHSGRRLAAARNDLVRSVWRFLEAVTEPALRPIRRVLPNLGGIDVSPVILLLIILFVQKLIVEYAYTAFY